MTKIDVSDPDASALDLSRDDRCTTNLNPSKPDIFKLDPPDPDLLKSATSIPAPSPPGLGRDVEEPAVALLTEISASLGELKGFSARIKLVIFQKPKTMSSGRIAAILALGFAAFLEVPNQEQHTLHHVPSPLLQMGILWKLGKVEVTAGDPRAQMIQISLQ